MSSGMPELGSKISLISKADIRYEGRLFTVDPQECTIALASVRSFGTEDRETQFPVAPQSQVYDYILFRGSDIKDIRVLTNVSSMPNDPAIVQMSVPPTLGGGVAQGQYPGQYNHPVVGQTQFNQYHPMAGFQGGVHTQLNKTSELSPQTSVELTPQPQPISAPIGSGVMHHSNQVKDQGSIGDLIGIGSQQNASRSGTPAAGGHRKSPTTDQETQVGSAASGSGQRESRRGGGGGGAKPQNSNNRARPTSRTRQRVSSGSQTAAQAQPPAQQSLAQHNQPHHQQHHQHNQHNQHNQHTQQHQYHQHHQHHHQSGEHHHQAGDQHYQSGYNRGAWRMRSRGRGRGSFAPRNKNTLKFENDYDFEQANTEFEELRSQLAKAKISDGDAKVEASNNFEELRNQLAKAKITDGDVKVEGEVDKKDDSGNETGAGEEQLEDDSQFMGYDKKKSFFDNISCEAVERSKGRSQRTDWRTERKLNSETFGVASARRGAWRGRAAWRHPHAPHAPHSQHMQHQPWRALRGGRGRPHATAPPTNGHHRARNAAPQPNATQPQPQPPAAAAK